MKIDGRQVEELDLTRDALSGKVVQAGKRRFARLVG